MQCVLLLHNIEKNTNLGQMIRTANALGVHEVCVVGKKKYSSYGNKKTHSSTSIRHFFQFEQAKIHYKNLGFDIAAIEISQEALNINDYEFTHNTVFVMGNEGIGISDQNLARCDYCLYIPQFGSGASINVNVACGIALNAYMQAAQRPINSIVENKFVDHQ